jgi:hypothetical protein
MSRFVCVVAALLTAGALLLSACGDSPTAPSVGGTHGTLNVRITDGPYSDARALLVTFTDVRVHRNDDAWITLPFVESAGSRTCDLKKLANGAQDVLGVGALAPGHYDQIRIDVAAATIYFDNKSDGPACATRIAAPLGRNEPVTIPSGTVRLNREFDLASDSARTMVLDFDGDKSVHATGNGRFMMQPVITVVSVQ